ncbi:hypothetical protein OAJ78_03160 [Gammaproteobacteria bacterium]|nr:hypothetical protein [Gammaproteobacteria bacterium]
MYTILTWDCSEKSSPIDECIGDGLIGATLIGVECERDSLMVGHVAQPSQLTLLLTSELSIMRSERSTLDKS